MTYLSNVTKLYFYRVFSSLEFTLAIYVLFMLSRGISLVQVMVLETIFMFFLLFFEVPSGAFADKYGRRLSLILCEITAAIGFVIFGLSHNFWLFVVAQIFMALAWAFMSGADIALLYDSLVEERKQKKFKRYLGRANMVSHSVWAVGSILSGLMAIWFGFEPLFYFTALSFMVAAVIALTLKEPPVHKHLHEKNYLSHIKEAFVFSWKNVKVRSLIIYFSLFAALGHLTWFVLQPYYDQGGFSYFLIGIVVFVYFITFGLGSIFAEKVENWLPYNELLIALVLVSAVCFMGMYFVSPWIGVVLIGVMSFACGVRDIVISDEMNKETSSHHRATVMSVKQMGKGVIYAVFSLIIGWSAQSFSPGLSFFLMGAALLIFSWYFALLLRNGQNVRKVQS